MEPKYTPGLSFEEAGEKYREIKDKFEKIKAMESPCEEDIETLSGYIGALSVLGGQDFLQEQVRQARIKEDIENTLHYQIGKLHLEITGYLASSRTPELQD